MLFDYSGGRPSRRRAVARAVDQGHPDAHPESMRAFADSSTDLCALTCGGYNHIKVSEAKVWVGPFCQEPRDGTRSKAHPFKEESGGKRMQMGV